MAKLDHNIWGHYILVAPDLVVSGFLWDQGRRSTRWPAPGGKHGTRSVLPVDCASPPGEGAAPSRRLTPNLYLERRNGGWPDN